MRHFYVAGLVTCLFLLIPACADDDAAAPGADAGVDATPDVGADTLRGAPDPSEGWVTIEPGGDTICARGTPYRFLVRTGTTNRLVVDFMGGGACWDELTCSVADAIFNADVEGIEQLVENDPGGIYDRTQADNPFADWTHVFIPYCTGDIHWGDATTTYGSGDTEVTIHHRGAVNVRAVLDWVEQSLPIPDQIFVTGCSAGAYGSIMWAAHILDRFPGVDVVHFADSGAGVITDDFFRDSFPSWNAYDAFPDWIDGLDPGRVDVLELDLADLYIGLANEYPSTPFTLYNTIFDENQTFYFQAMGGEGVEEWSARMEALVARAEAGADNVHSFTAPGEQHCIIPFDDFYTVEADGVRLVDWLDDLLAGRPAESVHCTDCDRATGE